MNGVAPQSPFPENTYWATMQDDCVRQFANILAGHITLYVFGALVRFINARRRVVHQGLVAETRAASVSAPLLDGTCTRATSRYLPSSALKIEASPSFTSNQSLPRASMMLGLCVMRKVFLLFSGNLRAA